jgi:hypothetical protein
VSWRTQTWVQSVRSGWRSPLQYLCVLHDVNLYALKDVNMCYYYLTHCYNVWNRGRGQWCLVWVLTVYCF